MSRSRLSLFELDRPALDSFSSELRAALAADDRAALLRLLALEGAIAEPIQVAPHAVCALLTSESHPGATPVFDALRRAASQRGLRLAWTSEALSLEGRLRGFEPLRDDPDTARRVDALLDGAGVPWFLKRQGATCGTLARAEREQLAEGLEGLEDPPPEIVAFASALAAMDGDALVHDTL